MSAEKPKAERVLKLLLETFPEHPRSELRALAPKPEQADTSPTPILLPLMDETIRHGIPELNSALSE